MGRAWEAVIRMVLGGIADRLDLGFDQLDDLQLAVERLLAEGDPHDPVTLSFELSPGGVPGFRGREPDGGGRSFLATRRFFARWHPPMIRRSPEWARRWIR